MTNASRFQEHEIKTLFGRKVAIDASMSIYQFLIAVRSKDGEVLTNEAGETTRYVSDPPALTVAKLIHHTYEPRSHLMGFFYRTIRMVENGIKPAYVFDGKPPELKSGVVRLDQRASGEVFGSSDTPSYTHNSSRNALRGVRKLLSRARRRRKSVGPQLCPKLLGPTSDGALFLDIGTTEDVDRLSRRTVRVSKEHNEECRRLLKLMGIPVIVAPSEAEAQCAELARGGKVSLQALKACCPKTDETLFICL